MNYLFLSERGSRYEAEEGTTGRRVPTLEDLEGKLKAAIVSYKAAVTASLPHPPPMAPGRNPTVLQLRVFHEAAQQAAQKNTGIEKIKAEIKQLRAWLERQDCVVAADGSITAGLNNYVVKYDHDPALQEMTKVKILGGRLCLNNAEAKPLDTSNMVTNFSGPGYAIYVMSVQGNIHVSPHSVGHRHHSSLLAGANVAGAGELKVSNGRLIELSNKSGHYSPSEVHLLQVLHQLEKSGIPMTFALTVQPKGRKFPTVTDYLRTIEGADQPDYGLSKLMQYAEHLTDDVLCQHQPDPWRWRMNSIEKPGVYSATTNQPVAHKAVRQWLKSKGLRAKQEVASGSLR